MVFACFFCFNALSGNRIEACYLDIFGYQLTKVLLVSIIFFLGNLVEKLRNFKPFFLFFGVFLCF